MWGQRLEIQELCLDIRTGIKTFDSFVLVSRLELKLWKFESWYRDWKWDYTILSLNIETEIKTFEITVLVSRGASLTRETMYVTASRDDIRDHLERRRTWSPRQTMHVITSRDDVRDCLEKRHTWLPQETMYVSASRVSSNASRCCDWKWLIINLKSFVKASYSSCCSDTPK